jgi:hypothetical protein
MANLLFDFTTSRPLLLSSDTMKDLHANIRYPQPSMTEIVESGFSLPDGEALSTANYDEAAKAFIRSPNASGWIAGKEPASTALFPCKPSIPVDVLVEKLKADGLWVAFVEGNKLHPSGFMVTKTGADLSHHIAAAYVAAGFVPPVQTLQDALERHPDAPMKAALVTAAKAQVAYCRSVIDSFEDILDQDYDAGIQAP